MPNEHSSYLVTPRLISAIAYSKKCKILTLICLALIAVIFQRGFQLGLVSSVTDRIRFHAIPVAVSFLYHGHPHDYTAAREVAIPFQGAGPLHELLADSVNKEVTQRNTYYWVADDKGFGDFVIVAFKLFGPKTSSMYLMWFVCLAFTTVLFLTSFPRRSWCLGLLGMLLVGIYTAISTLPLTDEANFLNFQSSAAISTVSIYEVRFLDVLAMIPVIHICLFTMRRSLTTCRWQMVAVLGQVGFFFLLYHARSSLGWQLVAMIGFLSLVVIYRLLRSRNKEVRRVAHFLPAAFVFATLLIGLIGLSIYKHATYNPRYFQDMGVRTFWHNALMGVVEPGLATTYRLAYGDFEAARAVIKYSQEGTCQQGITQLDPQGLLNSLGGHGEQDWFAYESCAKKLYFHLWKKHSIRMAYNYVVLKPMATVNVVLGTVRSVQAKFSDTARAQFSIGWYPLTFVPLLFGAAVFLVAGQSLYRRRAMLLCLLATLLVFSLIPSLMFYAAILTLGGFFVTLTILCYLFLLLGARASIRWLYEAPVR